jgi:lipoyl(octanoyl) transferase
VTGVRATMQQAAARLQVRQLGLRDYVPLWREMQTLTAARGPGSVDRLWLLEHPPVFTLGLNARPEHLLDPGDIPVVNVDRGGQVTYHGPGQLVAYLMFDLRRHGIGIRALVEILEQSVIDWLAEHGIAARARRDAPGVYVGEAKIAALGLRVKQGRSYHGLSFNVDMDLQPFTRINPCGHAGLPVTQLRDLGIRLSVAEVAAGWVPQLADRLTLRPDWEGADGNRGRQNN